MPKLSKSKGQWFILSAVFVSGIFLTISTLLSSTIPVDSSRIVQKNEDYFFNSIEMKIKDINCSHDDWQRELEGFIYNTRSYLNEYGYLLEFNYEVEGSCMSDYNLSVQTSEFKASN